MTFTMEKLELYGHLTAKNIEDMFIRFDRIHERGGRALFNYVQCPRNYCDGVTLNQCLINNK